MSAQAAKLVSTQAYNLPNVNAITINEKNIKLKQLSKVKKMCTIPMTKTLH